MSNLLGLVQNEVRKIYLQKATWIMYIVLVILIIGSGILTYSLGDRKEDYSQSTWQAELEKENEVLTKEMEREEFFQDFNSSLIAQNNYYLENNIQPVGYGTWQFVMENEILLSIVSLLTIIVASGIVANEFRWGTIKLLLIRPISRTKILVSKYAAVLVFALCTLLFVVSFSWIIGALLFGVEGLNPHIVLDKSSGLEYVPIIGEILTGYGFKMVDLVMMATFAFMISSIFRNSALAIGTAVFLMMAGTSIVMFFADHAWAKYILFANTNLSQYVNGNQPLIEGMTLTFSTIVLLIYLTIFLVASWYVFSKRDIAGN